MYDQRPLKSKLTITIDSDVLNEIKRLAEEDDRTVSQYINRVLKKHLISMGLYSDKSKGGSPE